MAIYLKLPENNWHFLVTGYNENQRIHQEYFHKSGHFKFCINFIRKLFLSISINFETVPDDTENQQRIFQKVLAEMIFHKSCEKKFSRIFLLNLRLSGQFSLNQQEFYENFRKTLCLPIVSKCSFQSVAGRVSNPD